MSVPNLLQYFERAKLWLQQNNFDFAAVLPDTPSNVRAKRGAWAITALGAWFAHLDGHTTLGLVAKSASQNHYEPVPDARYAVDGVMFSTGEGFDVVEKAETLNKPMWGRFEVDPPLASWRPVFDPRPFLGLDGQVEPPPPPPPPPPAKEVDLEPVMVVLEDLVEATVALKTQRQNEVDLLRQRLDLAEKKLRVMSWILETGLQGNAKLGMTMTFTVKAFPDLIKQLKELGDL